MSFNKPTTIVTAGVVAIGIILFGLKQASATTQDPAIAATQQPATNLNIPGQGTTPSASQIADLGLQTEALNQSNRQTGGSQFTRLGDLNKQIESFVGDVTGFIQKDVLGTLNGIISSTVGAIKVPDLSQITSVIMGKATSSTEGTKLSERLEGKSAINGSSGSYRIMDDYNMHAQRTAAVNSADAQTLSTQAQAQTAQVLAATKQDTETNIQLGNDSQNQDVTQRILQNLSQQTALNAQTSEKILRESQQSRTDGAISNVLSAQTAKEVSAKNTADRREAIASGNQSMQQSSMLMMPGGYTLKKEGSNSKGSSWFSK